jgi:small subunit ribosomal protein S6
MPSVAITRPYEAVYIVDPDMGEEQISTVTNRYKQIVETNGGTVAKVDVWERRKLAYMIKGRTEGIYVVMHFSGPAQAETELRRIFQISEDQIRALIVRQDEAAPDPLAGEPEAPAVQAAPAAPAVPETPIAAAPVAPETPAAEEAPTALSEANAPALAPEQAPTE